MRKLLCAAVALVMATGAYAELQSVEVGGEVRIRMRHFGDVLSKGATPSNSIIGRSLGLWGYDSAKFTDLNFVEQRSTLNLKADFTDDVSAFIEFESWGRWGEDFRSNPWTGADMRASTVDDVELFQGYIDVKNMYGTPLSLRIGRQELSLGKSWLIGSRISSTLGMSYDGVRATYDTESATIDAFWMKLAERSGAAQDDDTDLYGVYGTYKGFEHLDLSLYWLYVRDGRSTINANGAAVAQDLFGWDDYDPTELHTVGLRAWGAYNNWSYDLELAYQFGEADAIGASFLLPITGRGNDDADFDAWAGDLTVSYQFETKYSPMLSLNLAYFEGNDDTEISFFDWLNPFDQSKYSHSFNRLFSGRWYGAGTDILGGAASFTNFYQIALTGTLKPTEKITAGMKVAYLGVVDPAEWPAGFRNSSGLFPILPALSIWTDEADDEIGTLLHGFVRYQYSPDLWVSVGWEHIFTGDGLDEGNYLLKNGLDMLGGTYGGDPDYIYLDTQLKF